MAGTESSGHRRVTVSGISIDMLVQGHGRPLLLLHGVEGPTLYGTRYIDALAEHFQVFAPWHPGFGGSERPDDMRSVDDLAYFYLDLAQQLGLQDAVLFGASFGGWIAAELAIRSTARFGHLVLAAPLGIKLGGREERDILDLHAIGVADWPRHYFAHAEAHVPDFTAMPAEQLLGIARAREALTLYGWRPYMHNPRLRAWLHRIDIPTMLIWGDHDAIVGTAYARGYAAAIPHSDLRIIPGAGHLVAIERAPEVARLVQHHAQTSRQEAAAS